MLRAKMVVIAFTILVTCAACVGLFHTSFAKNTIDYFSFFAALFLIIDGIYKIRHYRSEPYFPGHLVRHIRIIIGSSVFTIHLMQYIYGA